MMPDYDNKRTYQPCECGKCDSKAAFKKDYGAYLNQHCLELMEKKAARDAIRALKRSWKNRGT